MPDDQILTTSVTGENAELRAAGQSGPAGQARSPGHMLQQESPEGCSCPAQCGWGRVGLGAGWRIGVGRSILSSPYLPRAWFLLALDTWPTSVQRCRVEVPRSWSHKPSAPSQPLQSCRGSLLEPLCLTCSESLKNPVRQVLRWASPPSLSSRLREKE